MSKIIFLWFRKVIKHHEDKLAEVVLEKEHYKLCALTCVEYSYLTPCTESGTECGCK